jgi:hypothetical protein
MEPAAFGSIHLADTRGAENDAGKRKKKLKTLKEKGKAKNN